MAKHQERKNDGNGVQPNAFTQETRREVKAFEQLPCRINCQDPQHHVQGLKLQQRSQHTQDQAHAKPQIRNKHRQACEHPNRPGQIQTHERQTYRIKHGQYTHDHELPAQVMAEYGIGICKKCMHGCAPARRNQRLATPQHGRPVEQ